MSKLQGNRQALSGSFPFLIGANPNRVAPSHVYNGFIAAGLGVGEKSQKIAKFIRDTSSTLNPPDHVSQSLAGDPQLLRTLAEALVTVLDPDHRVFPSGGSPFPICPAIVSENPSDDQFGSQLGAMCSAFSPGLFDELLNAYAKRYRDPVAVLGSVLNGNFSAEKKDLKNDLVKRSLKGSGPLCRDFFDTLANVLNNTAGRQYGTLSAQLVSLGRCVYFASFLAALRMPVFAAQRPKKWQDLKPLFVYGGKPPGVQSAPAVRLAVRSYSAVVSEIQGSLKAAISEQLEAASGKVPRAVSKSSRTKTWIQLAFPKMKDTVCDALMTEIKSAAELKSVTNRMTQALYPIEYVARAYRTFGRMLGMVGPDRGTGNPRFILETPVLGLLAESTLESGENLAFEDWIDRVYDRFGIVLGFGRNTDPEELLSNLDRPAPLRRALKESHNELRQRLVLAGLAVEYSDGETEMVNLGYRTASRK